MKIKNKMKYMALATVALLGTTSCEKDMEAYSNPDCYLNFVIKSTWSDGDATTADIESGYSEVDRNVIYNFKFKGDTQLDTVWVDAKTMGFVTDYDREFALEQVQVEGEENAVAGEDYVAFDSPEAQKCMVVKAGENRFRVPVLVKRSEKMKTKSVALRIRFKENSNFKNGLKGMQERTISITDRLSKPAAWDDFYLDYYIGLYGEKKHELMIQWSGKAWDDEYITEIQTKDPYYVDYMVQIFTKRLNEENAKRAAQGLGPLSEADGTPIDFYPYYPW